MKNTGTLWSWGWDFTGQLGNGLTTPIKSSCTSRNFQQLAKN
ncbi:hypothetical protein [Flavobacterium paronense]